MFLKGYAFALASALVLASMAGAIAAPAARRRWRGRWWRGTLVARLEEPPTARVAAQATE